MFPAAATGMPPAADPYARAMTLVKIPAVLALACLIPPSPAQSGADQGKPPSQRAKVHSGPADVERKAPPRGDFGMGRASKVEEPFHAEGLAGFDHAATVNRDPAQLFGRGLGRADPKPSIDLHRIGGNQLEAVSTGQGDGQLGFADPGWAGEDGHWGVWVHGIQTV